MNWLYSKLIGLIRGVNVDREKTLEILKEQANLDLNELEVGDRLGLVFRKKIGYIQDEIEAEKMKLDGLRESKLIQNEMYNEIKKHTNKTKYINSH